MLGLIRKAYEVKSGGINGLRNIAITFHFQHPLVHQEKVLAHFLHQSFVNLDGF